MPRKAVQTKEVVETPVRLPALMDAVLASTAREAPSRDVLPPLVPGETRTILPALEGDDRYEVSVNQTWLKTGQGRPLYVYDPATDHHHPADDAVCVGALVAFLCREGDRACGLPWSVRQVTRGPVTVINRPKSS